MVERLGTHELQSIRDRLAGFEARCAAIMALLGDKRHLSREDRTNVEELYRSLKDDLKRAATVGTVSGEKRALTDAEERFYAPAARAAALALAPAVNSNPITSNWFSALYDAQIEFAHYMPKLEGA
jgi:two-component sensor histidine kinase